MKMPRIIVLNKWVVMALVAVIGGSVRLIVFDELPIGWHLRALTVNLSVFLVVWESFRIMDEWFNRKLPMREGYSKRILAQLAAGIVFMVSLHLTLTRIFESSIPLPINSFFYIVSIMLDVFVSVSINLAYITKHLMDDLKQAEVNSLKLQREQFQMQFNNLKNQLNPHFLFNMLASLDSLIADNPNLASDFLKNLAKVYRYLLQYHDRELVPLQTELDFVQHYVFLLKVRFENALNIHIHLSDAALQRSLVPATLFVLLENAIKHNIATDGKPLQIEISDESEWLVVQNGFQPKQNVETSNKQGLVNLAAMYNLLSEHPPRISSDEFHFTVKIPLL